MSAGREAMTLAEAVRAACLDAARDGYRAASISGLCAEGAWEAALGAIEMVDLQQIIRRQRGEQDAG